MTKQEKELAETLKILRIMVTYPQSMWMEVYSSGEQQLDMRLDC